MSDEINKKLFEHYTNVANGNIKSGNSVRDELNISDAKRHLADLISKNSNLGVQVEPKKISIDLTKEVKQTKSKEKK